MVREQACQRALTRVFWGGGALEVGDLRLLEDGGERGGALVSDIIEFETASEGQRGRGERVSVSTGIDMKANTRAAAHFKLVICVSLRMAASTVVPLALMSLATRL